MNTDVWALLFFFEKLKIVEKNLRKLNNCSYGEVSHTLKKVI